MPPPRHRPPPSRRRQMKTRTLEASSARFAAGLAALCAVAGTVRSVLADDEDDPRYLKRQPAVVGPIRHAPDPWKTATPHSPVGGGADDVFQSRNINLKTWIPLNNFPGFSTATSPSGADCWGYTAPSGREYALMGLSWGDGIVEVTNPLAPTIVSVLPGGVNSLWRDITVVGNYAYAVSDSSGVGIQVIDLTNIDTGSVSLVRNYSQGGHTTTHTILSNPASGYLYLCGGNALGGGMIPASTTSPTFPTFTGPGWAN